MKKVIGNYIRHGINPRKSKDMKPSIKEAAAKYVAKCHKNSDNPRRFNENACEKDFIAGAKSRDAEVEELIVVIKQKENLLIDAYKRIEQFKQEKI